MIAPQERGPATPTHALEPGRTPLLISVPHAGTQVAGPIATALADAARALPDTDWFVDRLWAWAREAGAGMLVARCSRYVVDLNRPPDDAPLYAARTTGLVPTETFDGDPVWREGRAPGAADVADRTERYWRPYHAALEAELARLRDTHGHAVLLDAHSIRGTLPRLFDGRLPDLNLGTDGGRSAAASLARGAEDILGGDGRYRFVRDGRFRGGYITRHYGRPDEGVHALQLEMAQRTYLRSAPPRFDEARAAAIRPTLERLVVFLSAWSPGRG